MIKKIKSNKKSIIIFTLDGGKYKVDLNSYKIYDITEKHKSRKLEICSTEIKNALYDLTGLNDRQISIIFNNMKYEKAYY